MFDGNPLQFAAENVRLIHQHWRGVRDGDPESIHQARVATRRARAALQIVDGRQTDRFELCRRLGRMLGKVREVDITEEVFRTLSTRVPPATHAIAEAHRIAERDQERERRRLVKALDDLKLRPLVNLRERSPMTIAFWKDWRGRLLAETLACEQALLDAIDRAPAVYMPNRVHRVRIATKKLRYALEVSTSTGIRVDTRVLRDLRKTQDLLGRVHDLDVARRILQHLNGGAGGSTAAEVAIVDAVLGAECSALHDRYLARRERLRAA